MKKKALLLAISVCLTAILFVGCVYPQNSMFLKQEVLDAYGEVLMDDLFDNFTPYYGPGDFDEGLTEQESVDRFFTTNIKYKLDVIDDSIALSFQEARDELLENNSALPDLSTLTDFEQLISQPTQSMPSQFDPTQSMPSQFDPTSSMPMPSQPTSSEPSSSESSSSEPSSSEPPSSQPQEKDYTVAEGTSLTIKGPYSKLGEWDHNSNALDKDVKCITLPAVITMEDFEVTRIEVNNEEYTGYYDVKDDELPLLLISLPLLPKKSGNTQVYNIKVYHPREIERSIDSYDAAADEEYNEYVTEAQLTARYINSENSSIYIPTGVTSEETSSEESSTALVVAEVVEEEAVPLVEAATVVPQTGDATPIYPILIGFVIALCALMLSLQYKKKQTK